MTLAEMIRLARSEAADLLQPYQWSNEDLTEFANDAENEACRRARLIVDSSTDEVTRINVRSSVASYRLDDRVIFVRRVKSAVRSQPLDRVSYKKLDECVPGWQEESGDPRGYITDFETGKIQAYPTPNANSIWRLTVVRLPMEPMKFSNAAQCGPEIHKRFHRSLVYWMLYRMYSRQDSETVDKQKAADNLALFEAEFGPRSSAQDENWIEANHGYDTAEGLY